MFILHDAYHIMNMFIFGRIAEIHTTKASPDAKASHLIYIVLQMDFISNIQQITFASDTTSSAFSESIDVYSA